MGQYAVRLNGYQSTVTSVILEVTNKQPIASASLRTITRGSLMESTLQPKTAAS